MTTTQTHAAQVLTDAETDQHLDAVLNGAGSALRHYTTEFSLSRMRAAMREHEAAILAKLQPAQAGELPDELEAFEAWASNQPWFLPHMTRRRDMAGSTRLGQYVNPDMQAGWSAWQARAALAAREPLMDQQARLEAFEDLVEDLAEWSRSVIEDTAPETLEMHVRKVLKRHGINGLEVKT